MIVERRNPARVAEVSSKPYAWNAVAAAFTRPSSRPARRSNETSREEEVGSVSSPARDVSFAAASRLRASSLATSSRTKEKGTRETSMRTAVSSAGEGGASDS